MCSNTSIIIKSNMRCIRWLYSLKLHDLRPIIKILIEIIILPIQRLVSRRIKIIQAIHGFQWPRIVGQASLAQPTL
ncbi:hypothetical protein AXX00_27050 [Pseudomonas aeruginosa]|nr:hypothetical protein AXX00_27050 [Pseudomonas aeruginosa]